MPRVSAGLPSIDELRVDVARLQPALAGCGFALLFLAVVCAGCSPLVAAPVLALAAVLIDSFVTGERILGKLSGRVGCCGSLESPGASDVNTRCGPQAAGPLLALFAVLAYASMLAGGITLIASSVVYTAWEGDGVVLWCSLTGDGDYEYEAPDDYDFVPSSQCESNYTQALTYYKIVIGVSAACVVITLVTIAVVVVTTARLRRLRAVVAGTPFAHYLHGGDVPAGATQDDHEIAHDVPLASYAPYLARHRPPSTPTTSQRPSTWAISISLAMMSRPRTRLIR